MTHPISGMKVLGIVEQFLDRVVTPHKVGLSNDESIDLLKRLVAHTRDPQFHYFHQWQVGDMVLWDNWRAMHCTTGTPPGVRRRINRTTIEGKHTLVEFYSMSEPETYRIASLPARLRLSVAID